MPSSRHPLSPTKIRGRLLRWYDANQRDLPWRRTQDPYRILVSEIMLQQTRVSVVTPRYREFLRRFPTLRSLAQASEASVLAAWSGLGYYRRARSLRQAAIVIVAEHAGKLPSTAAELCALPGIGRYTAAAVASIAFQQPVAVVDGTVRRVITRLTASRAKDVWSLAERFLDPRRPGDFNQAMMELGAMVCLPLAPRCDVCPLATLCPSRGKSQLAESRPQLIRKRKIAQALCARADTVYLVQRSPRSRQMPGMWELPVRVRSSGAILYTVKHAITNTSYSVDVYAGERRPRGGRWVGRDELGSIPLTGLARKILRHHGWLH